ncbi:hypothetical protein BDZ97DRAFT_698045 [Flammula alnicola]|nr:hypothetical protein BDZ97DRAFT_698045 [Flammula alnicola]
MGKLELDIISRPWHFGLQCSAAGSIRKRVEKHSTEATRFTTSLSLFFVLSHKLILTITHIFKLILLFMAFPAVTVLLPLTTNEVEWLGDMESIRDGMTTLVLSCTIVNENKSDHRNAMRSNGRLSSTRPLEFQASGLGLPPSSAARTPMFQSQGQLYVDLPTDIS